MGTKLTAAATSVRQGWRRLRDTRLMKGVARISGAVGHGLRGAATGTAHTARIAWPTVRRTVAGAVVVGWVGINAYWFVAGDHPVCQVTTVSQPGTHAKATVTQTCGLPDATMYLGVLAFVGLLLYPDAKSIWVAGFGIERRLREVEPAAMMAREAAEGDTIAGSVPARDAIQQRLGQGS